VMLAPVEPSKVVAIGRNYLAHVREMGYEPPPEPSMFLKPPSSVIGPGDDVVLPPRALSDQVQHEAELAIVIGTRARNLAPSEALRHVAGYTCADDVSARDLQRRDPSITRAKGFDTFCPVGPWIETELDPGNVFVRCRVDGELRQEGHTSDLIFDLSTILTFVSNVMTLERGDVVLTGSPGGTSTLRTGNVVEVEIEGIGTLTHGVRDGASPPDIVDTGDTNGFGQRPAGRAGTRLDEEGSQR